MNRNCLILRDAQGGLWGYVMQEDGRIALHKRSGCTDGGTLVCIGAQGCVRRMAMEEGAQEMHWPDEGARLEAAYGTTGGELLFFSGEEARRAYETNSEAQSQGAQEQNRAPLSGEAAVPNVRQDARWPPPPCLQGARYCGGVWRIENEM